MRLTLAVSLIAIAAVACSTSHDRDMEDGAVASCPDPMPTGCKQHEETGCCRDVPARCVDGAWLCTREGATTFSCEGTCSTESCAEPRPECFESFGLGCCGAPIPPVCATPFWSCIGGVERASCTAFAPDCMLPDCSALTEAECIASPDCGPLYDDFCCPLCTPAGFCADCAQPQMYACGSAGEACADDPPVCGLGSGWACGSGVADCSAAAPASAGRCTVAGCVVAIDPSCADDCPTPCVPVTGGSCTVLCRTPGPVCPIGTVGESDGTCWTGRCIPESACEPASVPGTGGAGP